MATNYKKLGYILIVFLLLFTLSFVGYLYYLFKYKHHDITVIFPTLGILAIDNPVKVKGKPVGRVKEITREGNTAKVVMEIFIPLDLKKDYVINERDKGLMGDREIEIIQGVADEKVDISKPLKGNFVPGIAESIGYAKSLKKKSDEIYRLLIDLSNGTDQKKSFPKQFENLVAVLEKFSGDIENVVTKIEKPFNSGASSIREITGKTREISGDLINNSDKALGILADLSNNVEMLITRLSPMIDSVDAINNKITADSTLIGRALSPQSYLDTLVVKVDELNKTLEFIRKKAHLNINLF